MSLESGRSSIDEAMEFWRQTLALFVAHGRPDHDMTWRVVELGEFLDTLGAELLERVQRVDQRLAKVRERSVVLNRELLHPVPFCRAIAPHSIVDDRLHYFIARNICGRYGLVFAPSTAGWFHVLTRALRSRVPDGANSTVDQTELSAALHAALQVHAPADLPDPRVMAFLETCSLVYYTKIGFRPGDLFVMPGAIEAEFLLCHLFGMPTRIDGFDQLFGGGGLVLPRRSDADSVESIPGRTIVVSGRFGAGKSLIATQLAVEVARKGGLGWIMPLEQSATECLYSIRSMGLADDDIFDIATDSQTAAQILSRPSNGRGALVVLSSPKADYEQFLHALRDNARMALEFDLVLVVVDPINSVRRNSDSEFASDSKARALILRELDPIKRAGCNVLIVQEDRGTPGDAERDFEKYIADTVIHTTIEQVRDYSQRYLEITKSRFQREQRGKHAFSIVPGVGLRVFPSSASVNARVRRRDLTVPAIEVSSGLQAVDRIIGPHGLSRGDVLVYEGSRDCPLHDVGTMFLGGATDRSAGIALYVSIGRSKARVQAIVKLVNSRNRAHWRRSNPILIVSLPVGHVNPGLVLQVIERAFDNSRAEGNLIERVLVDNVSDWTTNCPLIAQDEVFAPTLLDLIRKRGATSAFLCSGTSERLERSIVDGADCHIQLQPFDYRGSQRSSMRVRRTRHMEHQRGVFELLLGENGLTTKPLLLQFGEHGRPLPIKVRLFLHSESSAHRIYNRAILASIKAVVSPDAAIDPTEALVWSRALSRYDTSAVDELRIAQIDEFQLGDAEDSKGSGVGRLHSFSPADAGYGDERDSLLDDAVRCSGNDLVKALPYLDNLSLFAHRRGEFDENAQLDWHDIAKQADGPGDAPYFDFPRKSPENFNCLFLEILLSLAAKANDVAPAGERDWLLRMLGLEHALEAAALLRQLCRPAMRLARRTPPATAEWVLGDPPHQRHELDAFIRRPGVITVDSRARAWRHWFTTLREMTSTMAAKDAEDIIVRPLPGNVAISGRWYVGIPSNSAAPDDGVRILVSLLNRESELERLWHGVGLPVRPSFYANVTPEDDTIPFGPGARYVGPPIRGLLESAWRRSRIPGYARVASTLSAHLKRVIDIGDSTDVRSAAARVLASARRAIEYLADADS